MVKAPPAAPLRGLVRDYTGYTEQSALPLSRTEVPSGDVALIISFGPTITVSGPASARPRELTSFLAPLHESRAVTEYDGDQNGVEIRLTPPGARMVLGLPMGELTDVVIDLDAVLGSSPARRLVERLHGAGGWEARFALLDALLARRALTARALHPAVLHAWRRLVASDGRVPVSALTDEIGWSRRHLAARFRADIGLPPKALGRILRFQRVTNRLRDEGPRDLAWVALQCGYYDQSHLNRDFRDFAGLTPTAYAARLLPKGAGVAATEEQVTFFQDGSRVAA